MSEGAFKIGELVIHRSCGVCLVKDIAKKPNSDSDVVYYVLNPLYGDDKGNILRVPFLTPLSLRKMYSKEEVIAIIAKWPKPSEAEFLKDAKLRKQTYEAVFKDGDISLIGPHLFAAKAKKAAEGKLNSMDNIFLFRAEPLVFGQLAEALGIPYNEVFAYLNK